MIMIPICILMLAMGYSMGYWHGRVRELFESGKQHGVIAKDVTWEQWLKRNPKDNQ